jgi:hypothetical protein
MKNLLQPMVHDGSWVDFFLPDEALLDSSLEAENTLA